MVFYCTFRDISSQSDFGDVSVDEQLLYRPTICCLHPVEEPWDGQVRLSTHDSSTPRWHQIGSTESQSHRHRWHCTCNRCCADYHCGTEAREVGPSKLVGQCVCIDSDEDIFGVLCLELRRKRKRANLKYQFRKMWTNRSDFGSLQFKNYFFLLGHFLSLFEKRSTYIICLGVDEPCNGWSWSQLLGERRKIRAEFRRHQQQVDHQSRRRRNNVRCFHLESGILWNRRHTSRRSCRMNLRDQNVQQLIEEWPKI